MIKIISNRSAAHLCSKVVKSCDLAKDDQPNAYAKVFPSGEIYVQLPINARKKNLHIIGSFHRCNQYEIKKKIANSDMDKETKKELIQQYSFTLESDFRELEKICDAARRSGAKMISIYLTYYPDCRQDKKDESRVPISAKLTMDNLSSSAEPILKRMASIDLHAGQIQGMTNFPFDEIRCRYIYLAHLRYDLGSLDNVLVLFPDAGSHKAYESDLKNFHMDHAIISKSRPEHGKVRTENYIGPSPKDKVVVIFDDMIDSGGTMINAAKEALKMGAKEVRAYATHGIFSTKVADEIVFSEDKFRESGMRVYVSDTVPRTAAYLKEHKAWLTQFTVAPLISDLIQCSETGASHGEILKNYREIALKGNKKNLIKMLDQMFIY